MLPGFITLFKDKNGIVHLYFYKGLTDTNVVYYNDLDLSSVKKSGYKYRLINYDEYSKEFIFDNKNIRGMSCKLITYKGNEEKYMLKIK